MAARLSFFFGRALPLGVFGFLVAIQAELALSGLSRLGQSGLDRATAVYLLNRLLTLAFFSFLFVMYMVRGRAVAKDHNPLAVAAAMVGSFVLFILILLPSPPRSEQLAVLAVSNVCLAVGMTQAIYALAYLRHRFSLVPEARGLVTTGPYRWVRHPIYVGEIVAGFGLVLPTVAGPPLVVFIIFVAAEIVRTYYEERVLRRTYPEYAIYAAGTRRLVPFLY
jgi:protein-S-isoprenylcysteine O-methyltransferase Ste14